MNNEKTLGEFYLEIFRFVMSSRVTYDTIHHRVTTSRVHDCEYSVDVDAGEVVCLNIHVIEPPAANFQSVEHWMFNWSETVEVRDHGIVLPSHIVHAYDVVFNSDHPEFNQVMTTFEKMVQLKNL